ncbi:MAG: serine hydrolase [Bacteroidetes bacterium]|nr:serine hydrolase [Bacteroidota bacterium]
MTKRSLLLAVSCICLFSVLTQAQQNKEGDRKIDSLFASYTSNTPGVAVAVVQNGQVIFKKGYGMANLEHPIPITPQTVFDIASVSKQFTAFAVCLLESEGKLSTEDDVKKYIPELPAYAKAVKIKHLLAHTSGLKDHGAVASIAGYLTTDMMNTSQVLKMLNRLKETDIMPGTAFRYCNSSYVLLTEIIKRITGKSFADYTTEKIFTPLGMLNTRFADNHQLLINNRAHSYEKDNGRYYFKPSYSTSPGPSGLLTTVEDLVKWVQNFENPVVGTREFIDKFNEVSRLDNGNKVFIRLDDGDSIFYAKGQFVTNFKGVSRIGHGGHTAGFRTFLGRFPDQRISVIQLSNDEHNEDLGGRYDIAGFYIKGHPMEKKAVNTAPAPTNTMAVTDNFQPGLEKFAGTYYCEELETRYQLAVKGDKLVMSHIRLDDIPLKRTADNKFTGSGPNTFGFEIVFIKNDAGGFSGLSISNWGAINLVFSKI